MKKYQAFLLCSFLVVGLIPQVVQAGDQTNPEITDPQHDVLLFGLYQLPVVNRLLRHLDILSVWFSENSDEPSLLFVTLKVQGMKPIRLMGLYAVDWYLNGDEYTVLTLFIHGKENLSGIQIQGSTFYPMTNFYTFDKNNNTITWAVPKELIGNVTSGDVLDSPIATSAVRFCSDTLANWVKKRFGTNCIGYDITDEGNEYVILY